MTFENDEISEFIRQFSILLCSDSLLNNIENVQINSPIASFSNEQKGTFTTSECSLLLPIGHFLTFLTKSVKDMH